MQRTGIGRGPAYNVVSKIEQLVQVLVRYQLGVPEILTVMPGDETICEISYGMNLVALRKCTAEETAAQPENKLKQNLVDINKVNEWVEVAKETNPTLDGPLDMSKFL